GGERGGLLVAHVLPPDLLAAAHGVREAVERVTGQAVDPLDPGVLHDLDDGLGDVHVPPSWIPSERSPAGPPSHVGRYAAGMAHDTVQHDLSPELVAWLLDSDPALRWQVERDVVGAPEDVWRATRARVATEGFGARLLALQDDAGSWAGGAFFPAGFDVAGPEAQPGAGQPWTATTWSLNALREWGLDPAVLRERDTVANIAANVRWEYDDLPYWDGEVDACINGFTHANGVWLGADVEGIADWFVTHQAAEG